MPELPEVEVTRRSFAQAITGGDILDVRMGKPLRWPLGCGVADLCGRRIESVGRRGKYLLLHITDGVLLIHLGMSGSLAFTPPGRLLGAPAAHDHFDMSTHRGHLRLTDPRRFGAVVFAQSLDAPIAHKLLGHLGVEPLGDDFDVDVFVAAMRKRRAPIKQALLAGDVVVGVGNIYASEALFLAGIHPTRPACDVAVSRLKTLHKVIRVLLEKAVQMGGTTLKDFKNAQGEHGLFQNACQVYGRASEPCQVCARPIRRIVQGQRATYYCVGCQR